MALILIKEDGTGKVDANGCAEVADGDAYFDGHLYPAPWATAADDSKAEALVMATRLIDSHVQFNGWRANEGQALQWPRLECPDPDRAPFTVSVLSLRNTNFVPSDAVPKAVVDATCEMARELLIVDRTASPDGEGVDSRTTGAGTTFSSTKYNKDDTRPVISPVAQAMLSKFGAFVRSKSGAVPLVRT